MNDVLFTWHSSNNSISDFEHGLKLALASDATSILILACTDNGFTNQQINPLITHCALPIFGGIYPKLIYKHQVMSIGSIIIGFQQKTEVFIVNQLSKLTTDKKLEQAIEEALFEQSKPTNNGSFLIFYDALINNIEPFINCLFDCLEHHIKIIGGGAGNLEFKQKPCIFTNQGLLTDAIQLVSLENKIITSATHGWQILQGPFLVSESKEQTILSLNYSPAFDIYKEAIENVSDYTFNDDNFFNIAKNFPLGIEDINNQLVVRDPIVTHDGHIQCVGSIPVNSMVYLLKGSIDTLIASAKQAAITATKNVDDDFSSTMVFDCISRVLYMEDEFCQELEVIAEQCSAQTFFGVLSLGEIANSQSGAIKLLNKSTVIGTW
jgi:hypothetical protein